jgi:hypothetical protein
MSSISLMGWNLFWTQSLKSESIHLLRSEEEVTLSAHREGSLVKKCFLFLPLRISCKNCLRTTLTFQM